MAARLKRRSSIGFSVNKRDSATGLDGAPTTFTQSTEDEEAERRARNLQRKKAKNESTGIDRQGSSNRRTIGAGTNVLSVAQLAEHYNNCIKLSAKNVNLQLIDYMAKKIESDKNNFQDLTARSCPRKSLVGKKRNNRGRTVSAGHMGSVVSGLVWPFSPIKHRPQGRDDVKLVKTKRDVNKDPLKGVSARSKVLQKPLGLHTQTQAPLKQLMSMFPELDKHFLGDLLSNNGGCVETAIDQLLPVSVGSSVTKTRSKVRTRAHSVSVTTAPLSSTSSLPPCPECPVCYSPLVGTRIFQCGSGHHICQTCRDNPQLKVCPTCRERIVGRATNMEQFLHTLYGTN